RVPALEDATLFAIARGEDEVLSRLEAVWKRDPDPAVEWRTGWIQLAISGTGLDEEAIEFLVDDGMVLPDAAPDSAWLALHRGRADLARDGLDALRVASTRRFAEWRRRPELAIQAAWHRPRWILMLEDHAIDAVLARWFSSK
ncbi:MAG: hypothetical protein KC933_17365, partial [Myxococcales bacterium]|nr:hypothetical protein [Myxococcales bacterium]